MNERRIHQVFVVSVLLKGSHALIECGGGVALALIPTSTIVALANALTQGELAEDPDDFVANYLRSLAQHFSASSEHFYAFYLLSHGVVKICLVAGALRNKIWAYPASLLVMALFIVYQLYLFSYTHAISLVLLSGFDLMVMALIWHEYRLPSGIDQNLNQGACLTAEARLSPAPAGARQSRYRARPLNVSSSRV